MNHYDSWPIEFKLEDMQHKVGDDIYVRGVCYLSHGEDDFEGGLARITHVTYGGSAGKRVPFVEIAENPGTAYNYPILLEQQDKLKALYGEQRAHPDPDDRPEFNRWD